MSNMTKRALGFSLKKLLSQMPLDKITIQNIVDDAEVSRKTFYYHFQDIYDLLEWVLVDEGRRVLEGHTTADAWQQGLWNVLSYLQENRAVIGNLHRSIQSSNTLLETHITQMIRPILQQIFDAQPGHEKVEAEDRQFILELYAFGLVKLVTYWIDNGMKPEAEQLMKRIHRIFRGSMESMIQRYCAEQEDRG